MLFLLSTLVALLATRGVALPANPSIARLSARQMDVVPGSWDEGAVNEYPIHSSCNTTETNQLRLALGEMEMLVEHAKQHVLRYSNSSAAYQKYFGDAPSAAVIGNYDRVANGDKARTLFRCDDPDGNCQIPTYGGHWRGENATDETVICPLSYQTRRPLSQMCALGYNVAEWNTNTYFASDLLHRVYHLPAISEYYVDHFTEDYQEVLDMAQTNSSYSVRDSDALQYFALEVYAHDIAVPGVGCPGPEPSSAADASGATYATSSMAASSPAATLSPTSTIQEYASSTVSIPEGCHTHSGGDLHCD